LPQNIEKHGKPPIRHDTASSSSIRSSDASFCRRFFPFPAPPHGGRSSSITTVAVLACGQKRFSQVGKSVFQRRATSPPLPNHLGKSGLTEADICSPAIMN
jgi:hypothetical protein